MKKFSLWIALFGLGIISLTSCASTKNIYSESRIDLKIAIVNENNEPVGDYLLWISDKKDGMKAGEKYSNTEGFCFFDKAGKGKIFLNGYKSDYSMVKNYEINLEKNTNIYFFKVYSKDYVLNEVSTLYKKKRFEEGLNTLSSLYTEKETYSHSCKLIHEIYGLWKSDLQKEALAKLKDLKKQKQPDFYEFATFWIQGETNETTE